MTDDDRIAAVFAMTRAAFESLGDGYARVGASANEALSALMCYVSEAAVNHDVELEAFMVWLRSRVEGRAGAGPVCRGQAVVIRGFIVGNEYLVEGPPLVLPDGTLQFAKARVSCGTVDSGGRTPAGHPRTIVEVFADQTCQRCGHPPCPCCEAWCDVLLDCKCGKWGEDGCVCSECVCHTDHDSVCLYESQPQFTTRDGSPWNP